MDKDKLDKVKMDVISHLVKNAVLALIIAVGAYINHLVFTEFFPEYDKLRIPIYILLGLLLLFFIIRSLLKSKKSDNIPQFDSVDSEFRVVKKSFIHEIIDAKNIEHVRRYSLIANRNSLDSYKSKFHWTGGGFKISTPTKGHKIKMIGKKNMFDVFRIYFNRSINIGEKMDVQINFTLEDTNNSAVPFIASRIHEPTEKLSFKLIFPKTNNPYDNIICEISADRGDSNISSTQHQVPENKVFEWEIENPKLYHVYQINWS